VVEKGHKPHPGGKHNKGSGREQLQCWICGKYHHKKDCPLYQGGRTHIYSVEEVQTIGDVGKSISWIYETLDNKQVDYQTSIIDVERNLYD